MHRCQYVVLETTVTERKRKIIEKKGIYFMVNKLINYCFDLILELCNLFNQSEDNYISFPTLAKSPDINQSKPE